LLSFRVCLIGLIGRAFALAVFLICQLGTFGKSFSAKIFTFALFSFRKAKYMHGDFLARFFLDLILKFLRRLAPPFPARRAGRSGRSPEHRCRLHPSASRCPA
jgi:hypothetical protein